METTNKKSISLIAAIILSIIFHTSIIAAVPLAGVFNFGGLLSDRPLYAKIVSENSREHASRRPAKKTPVYPSAADEDILSNNNKPSEREDALEPASEKNDPKLNTEKNPVEDIAKNETNPLPDTKKEELIQLLPVSKESFFYDIYWLGIHVGEAALEASNNNGLIRITSRVNSDPFISAFYKVEDYAESNMINGKPSTFKTKQNEGKKRSDKETFFNIEKQTVLHINHIKETTDEHSINTDVLWDLLSGFYYLRTQNLNIGEAVYINIFDSNKFYQAEVQVIRKDTIKLLNEKEISAMIVKPILKSEGLFQNKGDISIWITDDEAKTPVRIETEVSIGKVTAELRAVKIEK